MNAPTCTKQLETKLLADLALFNEGSPNAPVLDLIGYGEEFIHCPVCYSRTDFRDVTIKGELGAQIHFCVNTSCSHVFLAAEE